MRSKGNDQKKWRNNSWFLLNDNAPAHRSVLVKDFLAENNVTTPEHPPYYPGVAPPDTYLFPWLKSALKGRCFGDVRDIIKNATEELKRLLVFWRKYREFCSLLFIQTNGQHTHTRALTHTHIYTYISDILYTVSTPTCFDAHAPSSGSLILLLC
jgi:hypothetical protein